MVHFNKLGLLGIRSFSPDSLESIKFSKPLTLILGHNGAGKTTIIEALKLAITGEVPSNSNKGQKFLYDPQLISKNLIKGQIRLILQEKSDSQMIIIRNFQLTVINDNKNKPKYSFKCLDSVVQGRNAQGEIEPISNKSVDINKVLINYMKVSKPVLDNVILCHQEDSLWPMSDSTVLKKKFDDIFNSHRYTKMLELVQLKKKNYTKNQKDLKIKLSLLEKDFERYKFLQNKLEKNEADTRTMNSDIEINEEKIKDLKKNQVEINKILDKKKKEFDKMQMLKEQLKFVESSVLKSTNEEAISIKFEFLKREFSDKNSVNEYIKDLEIKNQKLKQLETHEIHEIDRKIATLESLLSLVTKNSSFADTNDSILDYDNIKEKLNININLLQIEFNNSAKEIDELKNLIKVKETDFEKLMNDKLQFQQYIINKRSLEERLIKLNENLSAIDIDKDSNKRDFLNDKLDLIEIKRKKFAYHIDELSTLIQQKDSLRKYKILADKLHNVEVLYRKKAMQLGFDPNFPLNVNIKMLCIKNLNGLLSFFDHYHNNAEKLTREISIKCEKFCDLKQSINDYVLEYNNFTQIDEKSLTNELEIFRNHLSRLSYEFDNEEDLKNVFILFESLENNKAKSGLIHILNRDVALINEVKNLIEAFTNNKADIDKKLSTLETVDFDNLTENFVHPNSLRNGVIIQNKLLRKQHIDNSCASDCIENQKKEAINIKSNTQVTQTLDNMHIKTNIEEYISLLDLYEINIQYHQIKQNLESLSVELGIKNETSSCDLCDLENCLNETNVDFDYEQILLNAASIEQIFDSANQKIKEYEDELKKLASNEKLTRSQIIHFSANVDRIEGIQKEIDFVESEIKNLDLDTRIDSLNHQNIDEKINHIKNEKSNLSQELGEKKLNHQILCNNLTELKSKLQQLELDYDKCWNENNQSFRNMVELQNEKNSLLEQRNLLLEYINKFDLNLLKILYQIYCLNDEIDSLKFNDNEYRRLVDDNSNLKEQLIYLEKMLNTQKGRQSYAVININDIKKEIAKIDAIYNKGIMNEYRKLNVSINLYEMIIEDLKKFFLILDKALVTYHNERMTEINKSVKELWREIYNGYDIDSISIESDVNAETKSYDYRVVMYKNDISINMRGRCSAGQKVIASIVIRLALAEAFCTQCCAFTLDEPTTNLDYKNCESLAYSINKLIQLRSIDQDFQLILITHDENFVNILKTFSPIDSYYQVKKENGDFSTIRYVSI